MSAAKPQEAGGLQYVAVSKTLAMVMPPSRELWAHAWRGMIHSQSSTSLQSPHKHTTPSVSFDFQL